MNKQDLKERFIRMYLEGLDVSEYGILKYDESYFKSVLKSFKSWEKFEKSVGILDRHIREREKFYLYWKFKERKRRFGNEALRHKNIEKEMKESIQALFGTVKNLTENLIEMGKDDSLFYEAHALIISGVNPEKIKEENIYLYSSIIQKYPNLERFYAEYERKFLINPLKTSEQKVEEFEGLTMDIGQLLEMGYLTQEDAESLKEQLEGESGADKETAN